MSKKKVSDEQLYQRMERLVNSKRLYLMQGLSRDDLCNLLEIDKNRLGQIIKNCSNYQNCTTYINQKRLEYACTLLKEHPNYTIQSISRECGMSSIITFHRLFKKFYNITPKTYQQKYNSDSASE
jgi:AraC-like DNA-binding protein